MPIFTKSIVPSSFNLVNGNDVDSGRINNSKIVIDDVVEQPFHIIYALSSTF